MFAEHNEEMWYYERVHPLDLKKVHAIGFGFENVEVFSMDHHVIDDMVLDNYNETFFYRHEYSDGDNASIKEPFKMSSVEYIRIRLKKEKLEDTRHVSLDGMFSGTEEENIDSLKQHFDTPDLVTFSLFDFDNEQMVDIYVPWEGDSEYVNEAVTLEEDKDTITIIAMTKERRKRLQNA